MCAWLKRLQAAILQEPLILSRLSLSCLPGPASAKPETVFVGLGLCTRASLTEALPVDVLGMLLPAEVLRAAIAARRLVVLVADAHAITNAFDPVSVQRRARVVEQRLRVLARNLRWPHLEVLRASRLHASLGYAATLARIEACVAADAHPYIVRQLADVAYFAQRLGPLLKVGWALSDSDRHAHDHDEVGLDRAAFAFTAGRAAFVYCRAGRTLDDRRRKTAPYLGVDAGTRICLDRKEDVRAKVARARHEASDETVRGALRYYRALAATFSRHVTPLTGTVEQRLQLIIRGAVGAYPVPERAPKQRDRYDLAS